MATFLPAGAVRIISLVMLRLTFCFSLANLSISLFPFIPIWEGTPAKLGITIFLINLNLRETLSYIQINAVKNARQNEE